MDLNDIPTFDFPMADRLTREEIKQMIEDLKHAMKNPVHGSYWVQSPEFGEMATTFFSRN